jgi:hypothetical protein
VQKRYDFVVSRYKKKRRGNEQLTRAGEEEEMTDEEEAEEFLREFRRDYRTRKWLRFAAEVIIERRCRCKDCGRHGPRGLQVHHIDYLPGRRAWEYEDRKDLLVVLCKPCHLKAEADKKFWAERQKCDPGGTWEEYYPPSERELERLAKVKDQFIRWLYDKELVQPHHDWNFEPVWFLWNIYRKSFDRERKPLKQMELFAACDGSGPGRLK